MKKYLFLLIIPGFLWSMGASPDGVGKIRNGQKVNVAGIVRMVGNEPFTRIVVTVTNGFDLYLPNEMKAAYKPYVGIEVLAKGKIFINKLESADHKYKFNEYQLLDAELQALDTNYQRIINERKEMLKN